MLLKYRCCKADISAKGGLGFRSAPLFFLNTRILHPFCLIFYKKKVNFLRKVTKVIHPFFIFAKVGYLVTWWNNSVWFYIFLKSNWVTPFLPSKSLYIYSVCFFCWFEKSGLPELPELLCCFFRCFYFI